MTPSRFLEKGKKKNFSTHCRTKFWMTLKYPSQAAWRKCSCTPVNVKNYHTVGIQDHAELILQV